ncbi:MAG: type secretion system permease/ATPase [Alphaproteobacteria bacterium]|nr:type secretion system permease/ATPase [Alphaproteobacteria bacterium]MDB5719438.1 type secretion system permease/ATPase [Alphaproteobacteria bacterium]
MVAVSSEPFIRVPKPRFAAWLMEPMRRNRPIYLKVAMAAVMINLFGLVTSLFTMTVYDRVVPNNATSSLVALTIGFVIVVVFDFILKLVRAYFVDVAGASIDKEIGSTLFQRLLSIRLELKKGSTGTLTGLMRELEALRDFFASATMTAIVDLPFIFLTLALVAIIGGKVVFVPLAMIPLVVLVGLLTQPAMDRLSARSMGESLAKQSVLIEAIGGLETVKATGAGGLLAKRWERAVDLQSQSSMRQRLISSIGVTVATSAGTVSYAGVVIVGVSLIANQEMTMGGLVACSILAGRAIAPLAQISSLLTRMTQTRTAYRQLNELMEMPPEGPVGEGLKVRELKGRIEFRNVSFRYPGAPEKTLDAVSFTIEPGERVALLGRVGSGKSTILRLILGLYPPEEGVILLDGTDIRQLDITELRRHLGVALQESVLLTGSVRENIALGRDHVNDEELLRAAELSGTHGFIGQIANGYDLRLADRGEGLSGGQRQSIALARALAGRPPVMLFDEPSSAMDPQSETALIQRLHQEMAGRTMVLVTHRPPLLQLVTRILLVDAGKIVQDGPRDEVLKQITRPRAA